MNAKQPDDALARFRAAVMADPGAQQMFASLLFPDDFAAKALAFAAERGIPLDPESLALSRAPDPLGLHRYGPAPQAGYDWPDEAWLPVQLAPSGELAVDWVHFAGRKPDHPFFDESVRAVMPRPFNQLFRYRTPLESFVDPARAELPLPRGLIFHMSRCGSTLVSQMLGAVPENVVLSEAAPLDSLLQLPLRPEYRALAIREMAAALGRGHASYFLKLDAWHPLFLPLFREAFPGIPWIFLYRDPVEVLVSHARMPGRHVAPGVVPALDGLSPDTFGIDHAARILAKICEAVIANYGPDGLLVEYRELPQAVFTRVLPHFGIEASATERASMEQAALRDAKAPRSAFRPDSAEKRGEASEEVREAARHLAPVYAELEAIRAASLPAAA